MLGYPYRRSPKRDPWVYDYGAVSPVDVPYQSHILFVVELCEPRSYHLLPGELSVSVTHDEAADQRVVIHVNQIQHCVMAFGKPLVLGEWILGV